MSRPASVGWPTAGLALRAGLLGAAPRTTAVRSLPDVGSGPIGYRRFGLGRAVALATVLTIVTWAVLRFRPGDLSIAVLWPASGIALAAMLRSPRRDLPWVAAVVALGTAAGRMLALGSPLAALAGGVGCGLEALLSAGILLRLSGTEVFVVRRLLDAWHLLLATVGGSVFAGLIGAVTFAASDRSTPATIAIVAASHAAGIALVAVLPLLDPPASVASHRRIELVAQVASLVVALAVLFTPSQFLPVTFAVVPFLAWVALRLDMVLAVVEAVVTGLVAIAATWLSTGPFTMARTDVSRYLLVGILQLYVVTLVGTVVTLGLVVRQYLAVADGMRANETLFRRTFDEAMLGMLMLEVGPRAEEPGDDPMIGRCNAVAAALLDRPDEPVVGTTLLQHVGQSELARLRGAVAALASGDVRSWSGEVQLARPADPRWAALSATALPDPDGTVRRISLQMTDVTGRHDAERRLRELAMHDPLTGLPNRALLLDRIDYWLSRAPDPRSPVAVLFCDVDDFKDVNDSAGHGAGDQVLCLVAERMRAAIGTAGTVARWGGDEFVVLLPAYRDAARTAGEVGARLIALMDQPVEVGGLRFRLSMSIGSTVSTAAGTPETLLREADSAMYLAKRQGKNAMASFQPEQHVEAVRRATRADELVAALDRDELLLYVQPVVDLQSGKIVAGETLVRWQHPTEGLLPPGEWLDIAERSALVHRLGSWVIDRSCALAASWADRCGDEAPRVHVNVSARQVGRGTLVEDVLGAMRRHGLPGDRLVLELTETQLVRARNLFLDEALELRRHGVALAVDDFGTGYSSLTRLTELPIDMIKIDQSFVAGIETDSRARAIVAGVVTMSAALDLDVVAEGIETDGQAAAVAEMGHVQAQGFRWSRPVPPDEFDAMLDAASGGPDAQRVGRHRADIKLADI